MQKTPVLAWLSRVSVSFRVDSRVSPNSSVNRDKRTPQVVRTTTNRPIKHLGRYQYFLFEFTRLSLPKKLTRRAFALLHDQRLCRGGLADVAGNVGGLDRPGVAALLEGDLEGVAAGLVCGHAGDLDREGFAKSRRVRLSGSFQ